MTITHQDIVEARQKIDAQECSFKQTAVESANILRKELWAKCPGHIWGGLYSWQTGCCVCDAPRPAT